MELSNMVFDACRHYVADSAEILGCELTNRIQGFLRSRSVRSLTGVSDSFDPVLHGHRVLKTLLQVEAFFKKCDLFSNEDCELVAKNAFLESEEVCKATNKRLDEYYTLDPSDWIVGVVEDMRLIIAETLGPKSAFLDELPRLVRSTNGATTAHPRSRSGFVDRLKRTMYVTPRSRAYLQALSELWGYTFNFRDIHHNRVEFVPKNWKTHRAIACEPEGNLVLQLAFDSFCKGRLLKKMQIDLRDQSRNQKMAYESSVDGAFCTVDLKAASDRLALNVVHLLFPEEWASFFVDTRSPLWKSWDGRLYPYHKLSSMGNGYTFTVETLVFSALCRALGSRRYSVYGDDIIIETEKYDDLVAMLSYLGFEVNEEKSHVSLPSVADTYLSEALVRGTTVLDIAKTAVMQSRQDDEPVVSLTGKSRGESASEWAAWLTGLVTNRQQAPSSTYGVYRESCGVHALGGFVITPLYLTSLRTRRDWNLLMNNIMSFGLPGGSLWQWASEIIRRFNLSFGPPIWDRGAYVFIDTYTAYQLKLIRENKQFGPWQPAVRVTLQRTRTRRCYDSRALFLWFLHRRELPYQSSRHSLGLPKMKSKWVRYRPLPVGLTGEAVYLHWWTETVNKTSSRT